MSVPGLGLTVPVRDEGGEPEVASAGGWLVRVEARRLGEGRGENIMLELRDALGQVGGVDNSRTQCRTCMHACNRNGRKGMVTLVFSHVPNMLEETKKAKRTPRSFVQQREMWHARVLITLVIIDETSE